MDDCRKILVDGIAALNLSVDEATSWINCLAFVKLIEKWNKAYNLTAIKNQQEMTKLTFAG